LFSEELLEDPSVTTSDHLWYFEHKIYSFWEYVIVVQTLSPVVAGWHFESVFLFDYGIAISNLYSDSTTIWHEYGHHIEILEIDGNEEVYCTENECVMSYDSSAYYYCWYHWHLRI